ncbi:zeta toxin family protein, partial [Candidatus Uhrbacteria bacterium]|nr:zeta toxin family protein [Candidatus Uhrbacteria bacterium]
MNEEEKIREMAIEFAKRNKKRIAKIFTDPKVYAPDPNPISVFMAGSPGAGKTEMSKNLIDLLERERERRVIRIDGDEVRPLIPGYTGVNSNLFQGAISLIVEKMQDLALHQGQTFVLDGTMANYNKAVDNVQRSLDKNRAVIVFYVYQRPEVAWQFTQAREAKEGRNIPKSAFIEQFFGAKDTVRRVHQLFPRNVMTFLVKKDFKNRTVEHVKLEHSGVALDTYIGETYTKDELEQH